MDQRRFDFNNNASHSHYLLLDQDHQRSLLDLMAALITDVFHEQEITEHDQSQPFIQDPY